MTISAALAASGRDGGAPSTLWSDIKGWLHAPFKEPFDPMNWLLLLIFSATIAYAWARVLDKVLEE